ncbi:penicillin-binding protein activator [Marivivens donghaensis]|jgi:ABC-type branched-subunit amino acid transport system substrate-binding protein|uniref:penicillin-binding protein activator n=1 Tax=Marivivens donghaensis TaxID=1699413 RepID=UPI003F695E6C
MFAFARTAKQVAARIFVLFSIAWVAACEPIPVSNGMGGGMRVDPTKPVTVALLVPGGSGVESDSFLASNLENAARMAIADLQGVQIDLRVYNTGASPEQAATVATQAVNDGAKIILGPLYAEAANAAGIAVANRGVNVLAFSNNSSIAGNNVFVLGPTFDNTANRLVSYAGTKGIQNFSIVHGDDLQGAVGRDAIANAVRNGGKTVGSVQSYQMTQQGIISAAGPIANSIRSSGSQAVFLTGGVNADLPLIATALPEQGIDPAVTQYIGLTRWDVAPQALALPGLQGGIFAMPDTQMISLFESRYAAAYGENPHPLAGLAFDGIAAIGALLAQGNPEALSVAGLTQSQGFQGTQGVFRLLPNGTNQRALAIAQIQNNQVVILEPAPRSFAGLGF